MCGIAGSVDVEVRPGILEAIVSQLAHRGPDGSGLIRTDRQGWRVELGHRRLAIIDPEGGVQPLGNEDGTVWVTFNGEIVNFRELREELAAAGHSFSTSSDTEVLVHLYEQSPVDIFLRRLNGMFGFGLWDQREGRLLLARDRIGIKPLYYCCLKSGGLVFASELAPLLAHPAVPRRIDANGLASYFFNDHASSDLSLVEGINKLRPGHFLIWQDGMAGKQTPYWRLELSPVGPSTGGASGTIELLWQTLTDAVRAYLIADVPVGIFLSGGIDSSVVAVLARQLTGEPVRTFSIGFDDPDFDESPYARAVARHIGSHHTERRFGQDVLLERIDEILAALDEPLADPSFLPTFLLSETAADQVKCVLGGDGGDELWGGYPTYVAHRLSFLYRILPCWVRRHVAEPFVRALPTRDSYQSVEWKLKRFVLRWDDDARLRHRRWMSNLDLGDLAGAVPGSGELTHQLFREVLPPPCGDSVSDAMMLDLVDYLPGSVLAKVDRASMAHGLEVRPPFLHNQVVELALGLPSGLKVRGLRTKRLLRAAARRWLPDRIVDRPKRGFAIPLARWIHGPLAPRLAGILAASPLWETRLLDRAVFARFRREHQDRRIDRSRPLWALLVLDDWMRRLSIEAVAS